METDTRAFIEEAAQALSDLNTFAIVISTMENGHLHSPSYRAAERIITICKAEMDKRLRDYDRARAKAAPTPNEWYEAGLAEKYRWKGPGPAPAKWTAEDGTIVHRSYEDYCDD